MKWPFIIALLFTSLASCTSALTGEVNLHVWQQPGNGAALKFIVDSADKGTIPAVYGRPGCGDKSLDSALVLRLKHGTYRIKAVTETGVVRAEGELTVSGDDMQLKGISGGMDARQNMDCLSLGIR